MAQRFIKFTEENFVTHNTCLPNACLILIKGKDTSKHIWKEVKVKVSAQNIRKNPHTGWYEKKLPDILVVHIPNCLRHIHDRNICFCFPDYCWSAKQDSAQLHPWELPFLRRTWHHYERCNMLIYKITKQLEILLYFVKM